MNPLSLRSGVPLYSASPPGDRRLAASAKRLRILFLAGILPFLTHLPLMGAHSATERKMDPALRLLYRAAKENDTATLDRAAALHQRVHKKKEKAEKKKTRPRLELLVRYGGPQGELESAGFRVQAKVGEIFTGTVAVEDLVRLAELPNIGVLQSSTSYVSRATVDDRVAAARAPHSVLSSQRPSVQPLDAAGSGVLVGFIDTGIDVFHHDFRNGDGTTRIKYLLDFSSPGDVDEDGDLDGTGPYGGTLYTESQINAAITAGTMDQRDTTGHGTHGLSIAAGDDATYPGLAPNSSLIVVKATREDGTLAFTSADIINALSFVNEKASELGMPYVVNLSLGTLFSSHDGRSLEEQAIDVLAGPGIPGKAVVVAAGNASDNRGTLKRHYKATTYVGVAVSQTLTIPSYTPNNGNGNDRVVLDLWYEGNDKLTLKVTSPNGHIVTAPYGEYADQQTADGDVFIANLGGANPENGDVEAIVLIDDWTGPAPQTGNWTITAEGTEIGANGEFQAWLAEDSAVGMTTPTLGGGGDNFLLIGKPGGAYNAVTVGSYARHSAGTRFLTSWTDVNGIARTDTSAVNDDISDFSSPGKTRDGRVKPEITAPGERVMGAVSRDAIPGLSSTSIYRFHPFLEVDALLTDETTNHAFGMLQGTSFSAPVVTGLAARILSTNPQLDAIQVRNILINSATSDTFTGAVPNDVWGYGKADTSIGASPLPNDLRMGPDTLPGAVVNRQYNFVFTASGGTLPYTWFLTAGALPSGLTLESRGFLSGKPTAAGSYPITIQVGDSSVPQKTATRSFTIIVAASSDLHITSVAHPVGHLDKQYVSVLGAEGGSPPYGWTVVGGTLPPGLTLSPAGTIEGTPSAAGTFAFSLRVQDVASATAMKSAKIKVIAAGGGNWSVLGKSVPTVHEIVVDPNDSDHIIAATTGIDAVFESTNAGDSWRPISINSGLNGTARRLAFSPNSVLWGEQVVKIGEHNPMLRFDSATRSWINRTPCPAYQAVNAITFTGSDVLVSNTEIWGVYCIINAYVPFYRSSNGGTTWQGISDDSAVWYDPRFYEPQGSLSVAATSPNFIYSARAYRYRPNQAFVAGAVTASDDGGATWFDIRNGSAGYQDITVSSTNASDVLKAGFSGGTIVERTVDGGRNWTSVDLPPGRNQIQLRRSTSNPLIAIAGTEEGFYKSTDGGSAWSRMPIAGAFSAVTAVAIDPSDADTFYVAASDGLRRSRDGGLTWANASSGLVRRILGDVRISASSPTDVIIASGEGPFLSRTSGEAWTKSTPGMVSFDTRRVAISGVNPNLFFAGTNNEVYRSTNRGVTWTQVDGGVASGFPVVALEADPLDANYVLFSLSGTRGTYRSSDGGLTFASANVNLPFGTPNDLAFSRDPAHAGRVFVGLTGAGVYRSEDRGANWSAYNNGDLTAQTVRAVEPAPADADYVYAAGATQMYFLDPSIGTWRVATTNPVNPILSLAVDPGNELVAYAGADHPGTAGNTGGVYKTTDGGRNWTRLTSPLDQLDVVALAAHPATSGVVWAATINGGVFRTDDGGTTWKEYGNYGTVADLTNVNIQDPSNQFLLFAGTEGYGVQASTDSGKTFAPRVTGLGNLYVNALAFDPDAPSTLYAATDSGVFKSANSGNNWVATPLTTGEVTDLVTDNEGTGKRIWATVSGEGVAYSPDGGATFSVYSTGLASLQLTSLEIENLGTGKRIWATTKGGDGIAFSDNLGLTWTSAAGNGLTDRDINDLAIQSGAGKRIWATADTGVFMSDNDGLSWRDIAIGLPSGVPATSVSIDPNSGETLVSLFSEDGGGVYRGGSVNGVWREFSAGLSELKVKKLTRGNGFTVDPVTLGTRFYAATAGDGVYSTVLQTNVGNAPVVTTHRLPRALLREDYTTTLSAAAGTAPYTWSITEGSLPNGIALDAATGVLSGRPGTLGAFTFTVQAADVNQRTGSKSFTIDVVSPDTLQVTHCDPDLGVRGATLSVTVFGAGFVATPAVSFGAGVTVNSVTFVSAMQLTVNLTIDVEATPGFRTMTVTNPSSESASLADAFKVEYPTPVVSSINPAAGSRKETLDVVITGEHFDTAATVSFGSGIAVNGITAASSTSLTANVTISAGAALGARNVTVTNVSGFNGTLTDAFTVRAAKPVIASSSPAQGNQGATFNITLAGTDFQSGATSSFGSGVTVNSTTYVSETQLTANVSISSGAALGSRTATVTNPDAQSATLVNALLVMGPAPQVVSLNPSQGLLGQSIPVTVSGTGFQTGATVSFGAGVTVNSVTVNSNTQISTNITVSSSATPGMRNVTVTNLDNQSATKTNGFEVRALPPLLQTVVPAQAPRGATLGVVLGGTDFRAGAMVSFGNDVIINSVVVDSASQTTANITIGDTAVLGARSVTITNPDGQSSTLASSFTIRDFAPSISSVEPASLGPCTTAQVVVKGHYFRSEVTISFGSGVTVNTTTRESDNTITVSVTVASTAAAGPRTVVVTNLDTQSASTSLFQVSPPTYAGVRAAYSWIDTSAETDIGLSGDDESSTIPIGFPFYFCGLSYSNVTISTNGYLTFGGTGSVFDNAAMPNAAQPNALIAVYWDDLRLPAGSSKVTTKLLGQAPSRRLVVQWSGVSTVGATNPASFQAVLHEGSGAILLQYEDVTFGDPLHDGAVSATIGVENGSGTSALQIMHNTAGLTAESAYLIHVPACSGSPMLSVGDVTIAEGNSGTTSATFPVALSFAAPSNVTVDFATAAVTATAGSDFTHSSATLTFSPGDVAKTITVPVMGDPYDESDETFTVTLTNAANASVSDGEATGTVTNDDGGLLPAPSGIVATATATDSVTITWSAVPEATSYQIYRSSSGMSFGLIGTSATTSYVDPTASPSAAYLYAVKAVNQSGSSGFGFADLATAVVFTDPTLLAGTTVVKAAHFAELRSSVNAVRALAGLDASTYSDPALSSAVMIKSVHMTELRTALDAARTALLLPPVARTDATIGDGTTVKAAHITELRNGV